MAREVRMCYYCRLEANWQKLLIITVHIITSFLALQRQKENIINKHLKIFFFTELSEAVYF